MMPETQSLDVLDSEQEPSPVSPVMLIQIRWPTTTEGERWIRGSYLQLESFSKLILLA